MGKVCFCLNADIKGKDGICPCYQCEERAVGAILPVKNLVLGAKTIRKTKGRFKRRYT